MNICELFFIICRARAKKNRPAFGKTVLKKVIYF